MGAIRLTQFGGIRPRTASRLLPENAAQVATNCILSSGELVPLHRAALRYSSSKHGPLLSIYRAYEDGAYTWFTWPVDVDVIRTTLSGPAKFCFTGDGEPRITNLAAARAGLGNDYPHTAYTLGTPKPVTAATVAASGGVSATTVDRYYGYTFYASWDGVELEGAVSPLSALVTGKPDDTWAISGMDASPTSSGTVTGVFAAGYTTFTDTLPTWLRTGEQVVLGSATVDVTATPSATTFKVLGDYSAVTAWSRKAAFPGTIYKRLYRTAGTVAQFQLVAEGITGTTYNDTLTDGQILGDELISADWNMPPTDLAGLIVLPSGAVAGFSGKQVWVSEPDQPHAWPYKLTADHPIVAIASFGSGIAVGTESKPYIIDGVEPGQQTMRSADKVLPCVSKRSMVSLGDTAVYSSPSGAIAISGAGVSTFTISHFTDREWGAITPSSMVSALSNDRLYVLHSVAGTPRTLIFDLSGSQELTDSNFAADDIYADAVTGGLYFSSGSDIYEFDPEDGYSMTQDWMSREYVVPAPRNLGAAKVSFATTMSEEERDAVLAEIAAVIADNAALMAAGNVRGAWGASGYNTVRWAGSALQIPPESPSGTVVTFILYADGVQVASLTVENERAFRLPAGYLAERVSFRLQSQCAIRAVEIGQRPRDLGQV